MSFSYRVRFPRGTLKIKSESRLRTRERFRDVPVVKIGFAYFVWERKHTAAPAAESNNSSG